MPNEKELVKQLSIRQLDNTYVTRDIGVDYQNVEGLDTDAEAAKAKKATGDKNGKDITSYVSSVTLGNDDALNIKDGTPNAGGTTYQLAMQGATGMDNGRRGFVPQPKAGDQGKVLKGNGIWDYSPANDNIAQKEVSPATAEHKIGDRIIFQGILYKVIDDIEIGDTLVVNSNIELSAPIADCMSEAPNLQNQICANVENDTTSTKSYSVGQYLVRDNKLYRVIDNINVGNSFTEDVNIFEVATTAEITNLYRDLCDSSVTEDGDYAKHGHPKDSYFIFAGSIAQALDDISVGDMLDTSNNFTITNIIDIIQEMKTSFQDGVDTIYNAVVARGGTPSASTPSAIATAVNNLPNVNTDTYTFAANDTGSTKDMGEANAYRYVNAENVYTKGKADAEDVTWTETWPVIGLNGTERATKLMLPRNATHVHFNSWPENMSMSSAYYYFNQDNADGTIAVHTRITTSSTRDYDINPAYKGDCWIKLGQTSGSEKDEAGEIVVTFVAKKLR